MDPGSVEKLTVCCTFGDPWRPSTWSGTPLNLCNALQAAGRLERAIDASRAGGRVLHRAIETMSYLRYRGDSQHHCGHPLISARAGRVERLLRDDERHLLHLGIDHLPLPERGGGRRHYLYIDCTRRAIRGNTEPGWTSPRLVKDTDRLSGEAMAQMDHIFTVSRYVRDLLVAQDGVDPLKVTAVGTGRGPIKPGGESKRNHGKTVLFVAKRGFDIKGGPLVLEAFAIAHRKNPAIRLILAGRPEYPELYGSLPGVSAHGHVSLDDLQRFYEQADLFAMPAMHEPWGLVYLEALSCRVPVIGLRRNALMEITQDGRFGFMCDQPDPAMLADTLLDALSDTARLDRMGREGQAHCLAYYTWEQTVARMFAVISPLSTAAPALQPSQG
ncbi:MAG: glycosyltransferase family 4 protein [Planctomycetota bacterium]|nr:glycosyltransferase family 4 protein [Planctomycetota bacterium]